MDIKAIRPQVVHRGSANTVCHPGSSSASVKPLATTAAPPVSPPWPRRCSPTSDSSANDFTGSSPHRTASTSSNSRSVGCARSRTASPWKAAAYAATQAKAARETPTGITSTASPPSKASTSYSKRTPCCSRRVTPSPSGTGPTTQPGQRHHGARGKLVTVVRQPLRHPDQRHVHTAGRAVRLPELRSVEVLRADLTSRTVPVPADSSQARELIRRRRSAPGSATIPGWRSYAGTAHRPRQGITAGAPDALQVSDRFHLWQGLSRRVQEIATTHRGCLPAATPDPQPVTPEPAEARDPEATGTPARRHDATVRSGARGDRHRLRPQLPRHRPRARTEPTHPARVRPRRHRAGEHPAPLPTQAFTARPVSRPPAQALGRGRAQRFHPSPGDLPRATGATTSR